MIRVCLLSLAFAVTTALPARVHFVPQDKEATAASSTHAEATKANTRPTRSYNFPFIVDYGTATGHELWPLQAYIPSFDFFEHTFPHIPPLPSIGHFSPSFDNGLGHSDPLLLTGIDALAAAKYLYGKGELFFHQIPHARALLRNQEKRRLNGLEGVRLSSARPNSPFHRYGPTIHYHH